MKTSANRITIEADTELLAEEIRHNQNQILQMIASVAGIDGALELEILKPAQEYKAPKPIRPEEKLQYLREKNPLVDRLRKEIDLDIEWSAATSVTGKYLQPNISNDTKMI